MSDKEAKQAEPYLTVTEAMELIVKKKLLKPGEHITTREISDGCKSERLEGAIKGFRIYLFPESSLYAWLTKWKGHKLQEQKRKGKK